MTAAEIHKVCKQYKIENYTINEDGSIDVDGDVVLQSDEEEVYGPNDSGDDFITGYLKLSEIPLNFNRVSGNFDCRGNNFISLEGGPITVGGNYDCSFNMLSSLRYGPKQVGGDFDCQINDLTSLVGGPVSVGGDYNCSDNLLSSLDGLPATVVNTFNCAFNNLTSLVGGPVSVGVDFYCYENDLTSLHGIGKVGGDIEADDDLLKIHIRTQTIKSILES
jgi:hypothetical protein